MIEDKIGQPSGEVVLVIHTPRAGIIFEQAVEVAVMADFLKFLDTPSIQTTSLEVFKEGKYLGSMVITKSLPIWVDIKPIEKGEGDNA